MEEDKKDSIDKEWKEHTGNLIEDKEETNAPHSKLPAANFMLFLAGLATQGYIQLGEVVNPISKKNEQNMEQAKYTIDMLNILSGKTKGNITDDEKKYMEKILYDLRERYLKKIK